MLLSWVEKEIGNAILMISRMSSPNTAEPPFSYDDEEKAKKSTFALTPSQHFLREP